MNNTNKSPIKPKSTQPKKQGRGGKRKGAGRKKGVEIKPSSEKRNVIIQIKLTQAERNKLDQQKGYKNISDYIRNKLNLD